jgi:glycosyltransferase involved in cell wall biosynthesis
MNEKSAERVNTMSISSSFEIAVLVPCYNESKTIEKVVSDYRSVLPEATIYVYDNNSVDATDEIATRAGAVVRYEYKQGKGNVIRSMFREIDADCYLMIDGDDTYPAEHAREMVHLVLDQNIDMVIGNRLSSTYFVENKRLFHNSGNTAVRGIVNRLFHGNVEDIMTGYRAFSRIFVKSFPVLSSGFEIETEMTIHALDKNMRLKSISVDYRDRPEGSVSKLNTIPDGIRVLITIFRLFKDYKPLPFFGAIALTLFIIAVGFFIPILITFIEIHEVPRIPTLFISVFLMLSALMSFVCGLILDTEAQKSKQIFEVQFHILQMLISQK